MKIVFAPDSYKGSLSAKRICQLLDLAARNVLGECETVSIPVSDGGEGAADVVVAAAGGRYRQVVVRGPLGEPVEAKYGIFPEKPVESGFENGVREAAIIEMAAASGLPLVRPEERNVRRASTFGTGQMIRDALEQGIRHFHIAIGGSATNDGGIGCAAALGVRFLGEDGTELEAVPENLGKIRKVDLSGLHPAVERSEFTVICDVTNPLLGETGATRIFGPQKGASSEDLEFLETGMTNYANILKAAFGRDIAASPGAGAAGGLGAGLMAFTGAKLRRGIDTILKLLDFDRVIQGADLVITGEGMMDGQSVFGKVPSGVGRAARKQGIPCVAIVGGMGKNAARIYDCGVDAIITTINGAMSVEAAMENAEELFLDAAERMFRMIAVGRRL